MINYNHVVGLDDKINKHYNLRLRIRMYSSIEYRSKINTSYYYTLVCG